MTYPNRDRWFVRPRLFVPQGNWLMHRRLIAFAVLASIILTACIVDGESDEPATPTPAATAPIVDPQPTPTPGASAVVVTPTPAVAAGETPTAAVPASPGSTVTSEPNTANPTATVTPLPPPPTATSAPDPIPLDQLSIGLDLVTEGFDAPVGLTNAGDGSNLLFVLEQPGANQGSRQWITPRPAISRHYRPGWNGLTRAGISGIGFPS